MFHSEPRYTKDFDVWVDATPENAPLVYRALARFGAPLTQIAVEDFAAPRFFYQMGQPPVRIDIVTSLDGVTFSEAWNRRAITSLGGVTAHVIAFEDLIANKRSVGRPQDLADVDRLINRR
jgi:hypothetical protein